MNEPTFTGWGDPELNVTQNLVRERATQEALPIVCAAAKAQGRQMIPAIEAWLRGQFKFDAGWNFLVAEALVYAVYLWFRQNIGNCVGASHCMLLATRIAHEILAEGDAEERLGEGQLAMPFVPFSYGVGRLVGGLIRSRGDGSFCGAQINATMKYGFLPCYTPGLQEYAGTRDADQLPQGTSAAGRQFGGSQRLLEQWMPYAQAFDLVEAPKPENADEAWQLVADAVSPLQICSGYLPGGLRNDAKYGPIYTVARKYGGHSTQIISAFEYKGERFFVGRDQNGPQHPGSPLFDFNKWCYVAPLDVLRQWWRRGVECIGIGEIQGLPTPQEL